MKVPVPSRPDSATAKAIVAWPQNGTSAIGEKYRTRFRRESPSTDTSVTKTDSAYPMSAAMACIRASSSRVASRTTPAGFPPSGVVVKAAYRSTSVVSSIPTSSHSGPDGGDRHARRAGPHFLGAGVRNHAQLLKRVSPAAAVQFKAFVRQERSLREHQARGIVGLPEREIDDSFTVIGQWVPPTRRCRPDATAGRFPGTCRRGGRSRRRAASSRSGSDRPPRG